MSYMEKLINYNNYEFVPNYSDMSDEEFLNYIRKWVDKADADFESFGVSFIAIGRGTCRRLLEIAEQGKSKIKD